MRGGNQSNPLLRTFGRLCMNASPCSTSQEFLSAAFIQVENFIRREIHTTQSLTQQISKISRFGTSETRIRAAYLDNPAACLDVVRGSSAHMSSLTEASPATPPDVQGICLIFFSKFI